jgi:lysophospholipase L1-like esterase
VRRVAALAIGLLLAILVAEGGARLLESRGPAGGLPARIGERIDDPVLDYRTEPDTGENDAAGHRNAERLERADVVALGDSQTWGVNAERDETWPAQLAEITGLDVYNMGRGGYGIVQYRAQLEEALALEPRWVVVALYFGNDVYDAYSLVYSRDAHARLRHPDAATRRRIVESAYPDLKAMFFARLNHGARDAAPRADGWLARNSAFVRMLQRASDDPVDASRDRAWAAAHPDEGFVYDDGRVSTVFHVRYRLAAVDSRLPKIREGLRITLQVLDDLAARVRQAPDTRLLVLLVPTKERVFASAVARAAVGKASGSGALAAPPPDDYARFVREEERIAKGLTARMDRLQVRYLDLLPALEAALDEGAAIFPSNADGHFTPAGYARIAAAVAAAMDEGGR